jgi:hypothetical protein
MSMNIEDQIIAVEKGIKTLRIILRMLTTRST